MSNGVTYTVATTVIKGSTPENNGTWTAEIAEISGGDPAVVKAFNDASQASARDQVPDVGGGGTTYFPWTFESHGRVSFRSIAIGQVITGNSYFGVSPTVFHSTVVIDSRNARPIMLADLFTDEQAGLNRLSEQTKVLLPDVMPDQPGNAPIAKNFANWLPAADGLEIYFEAYQFGIRMAQTITVPWSALTDVLAPDMVDLAKS